jgi:hypothetical protein
MKELYRHTHIATVPPSQEYGRNPGRGKVYYLIV